MDTTLDGLLNQQLRIEQPRKGFRIAIDTVFLSATVPAREQQSVLELGCGVGGAMLCLAFRLSGVKIVGIDIQQSMIDLCRQNIIRNGFEARLKAEHCPVAGVPLDWRGRFDHVMMNPPYYNEKSHSISFNHSKRLANAQKDGDLDEWVERAYWCLGDQGVLTLIYHADAMADLCDSLNQRFARIEALPLMPKEGAVAKRILIRAYKTGGGIQYAAPFILHNPDNTYTQQAENILRCAGAVDFIWPQ